MCGIAGVFFFDRPGRPKERDLIKMAYMMRHRGPDGIGVFVGDSAGLCISRLSIIDLKGGWQPLSNEDDSVWLVCNGEIFNFIELRMELEKEGHVFKSGSDTEVIVHLYEKKGIPEMLEDLNGQFSFCLYDKKQKKAFLVRDRVGVHPLHYTIHKSKLLFASEVKALLTDPEVNRELDPIALDQVFTFWGPLPGRTLFRNISEVPPSHYVDFNLDTFHGVNSKRYWSCQFESDLGANGRTIDSYSEELLHLLIDATRIRLRADVPVGAYLSGGLDSSAVTSLIAHHLDNEVETFSIGFEDEAFNEGDYQREVIDKLQVKHRQILCTYDDISREIPKVIWHTEKPIIRTAPIPLFLLSSLVNDTGYRVVVTGEGADEFLGGYDIFKETQIRSFWGRNPSSKWRPLLLKRLYPYFKQNPGRAEFYLKSFFGKGLDDTPVMFSHRTRWETTSAVKFFFSNDFVGKRSIESHLSEFQGWIPGEFYSWHPMQRAQYLEIVTLLSQYLLSSQGDRVAMANSVEVRFPFLDPKVIDFSNKLPPYYKMVGLNEKAVLKCAMKKYLPSRIITRSKQPYMAPDSDSFFKGKAGKDVLEAYLSREALKKAEIFNPEKVKMLVKKCENGRAIGFKDNMAFIGILTTQIFSDVFFRNFLSFIPSVLPKPYIRHIH